MCSLLHHNNDDQVSSPWHWSGTAASLAWPCKSARSEGQSRGNLGLQARVISSYCTGDLTVLTPSSSEAKLTAEPIARPLGAAMWAAVAVLNLSGLSQSFLAQKSSCQHRSSSSRRICNPLHVADKALSSYDHTVQDLAQMSAAQHMSHVYSQPGLLQVAAQESVLTNTHMCRKLVSE
jgi:hypothetical protein